MRSLEPVHMPGLADVLAPLAGPDLVGVRSVELTGRALHAHVDTGVRVGRRVDLDVLTDTDEAARVLAARWGLTEHAPAVRPASSGVGEFVHRRWTGTLPTASGPITARVRTCTYQAPAAPLTAGPAAWPVSAAGTSTSSRHAA